MVAMAALSAARADALASMRLRHIDIQAGCLHQDARQVRTKYSKTFPTFFVPIGGNALSIIEDWVSYLQRERLWAPDDPLFPATQIALDLNRQFAAVGIVAKDGAMRRRFGGYFAAPLKRPVSRTAILIRSGKLLLVSVSKFAGIRKNTRRFRKTSGMRTF